MKKETKFNACKYLDFHTDFFKCEKTLMDFGKVFWLRDVSYNQTMPSLVQFCSKRGRLNEPHACLCKENKRCGDYVDFEHTVEVTINEETK